MRPDPRDDVERIGRVSRAKQYLPDAYPTLAYTWQDLFDCFRGKVAQQVTFREPADHPLRPLVLSGQSILLELRVMSDGSALLDSNCDAGKYTITSTADRPAMNAYAG